MKHIFIVAALALSMNSHAATQDLDQLLSTIEADIKAQRLAKPAGNNALERIDTFRSLAPFDFRITPLIFKFGESYVSLANKAMDNKKYSQAQGYLDTAWKVASLTPGLEAAQEKNDTLSKGSNSAKKSKSKGPTKAELKEQEALAAAAIAEKKRLDAERKKKANAAKQAKVDQAKKAAANRKAKEVAERKRRIANEKLLKQKAEAAKKAAAAKTAEMAKQESKKATPKKVAVEKPVKTPVKPVPVAKPQPVPTPIVVEAEPKRIKKETVIRLGNETPIGNGEETSAAIASYPLPQDKISNRDRGISEDLVPICKAIIDNDASIVLHAESKGDYRWLTVRLTLCTRRLDPGFRLRHSFDDNTTNEPFMTLHPARNTALLGDM